MKTISIIVPNGQNNVSSIVGPYKIFRKANEYSKQQGKKKDYVIEIVGMSKKINLYDGLFSITPHKLLPAVRKTDLIIIPASHYDFERVVTDNPLLIKWLEKKYKKGSEIASICTGAFLLAATGLLNGKECSIHWNAAEDFKRLFPAVKYVPFKLITDEDGLYTNGGAFSFLNLMLYLVEKYYDRETSIYCSKLFQIDINRNSQSEFIIFKGQKSHGDEVILEAQLYLEKNYREKIAIDRLSKMFSVSRRNFDRRFIKATGNTPLEYQQRVKIESAKKMFENSHHTISEVMYELGYSDSKAFRNVFSRYTGVLPNEYRKRFHHEGY
jgi:transcriptional regulator GlxA family with amidase domain